MNIRRKGGSSAGLVLALSACGAGTPTALPATGALASFASDRSLAPAEPSSPTEPPDASKYRVGDFVTYRYEGSGLGAPVRLTEEIVARQGVRLEIAVTAEREGEERRWVQVVTDTPENRHGDTIDELFLLIDGRRQRLDNVDNADLYRLYEWIVLPGLGKHQELRHIERSDTIAGQSYEVRCLVGSQSVDSLLGLPRPDLRVATVELCDSADFLWTKTSVSIVADDGEPLYQMVVEAAGRRPQP